MKKLFTLTLLLLCSITMMAQNGPMQFEGPSVFGVEAMNAWQENDNDVIIFEMTSTSEADITLPALTYNAMGLTIPSFTIHGAKFDFDYTTHNATFPDQTYSEKVTVDGVEKTITGYSLTATYEMATKTFCLTTRMSYGKMPVQVTYKITATYVAPNGIQGIERPIADRNVYDMQGRVVRRPLPGHLYIQGGKKVRF